MASKAYKSNTYIPNIWRSHPFYFIKLPLHLVLISTAYWLIFIPLLYARFLQHFKSGEWSIWFFIFSLTGFLLIIFSYFWKWRGKNCNYKKEVYVIDVHEQDLIFPNEEELDNTNGLLQEENIDERIMDEEKQMIKEKKPEESYKEDEDEVNLRVQRPVSLHFENEKVSIGQTRPKTFQMGELSPTSQNISTPLSPRELFFRDLIEQSNEHIRSSTMDFIKKERDSVEYEMNKARAQDYVLVEDEKHVIKFVKKSDEICYEL